MTDVEFRLILHDEFSKTFKEADSHVSSFKHSLVSVIETLGVLELAHQAFDFLKESVGDFEEGNRAAAQLEATLKSTGYAAGLNTEALAQQREELVKTSLYSDNAVTSMQSLLLTFTNIKGEVVEGASQAIADMSAKMGGDMQATVIQVGKALQDPVNGISALHRVGVNFSESQKEVIKQLVETGHVAEAQKLILKELNTEFGGSAAAAAKAAPWGMIKKQFEEMREAVGGFLTAGIAKIAPYVEEAIGYLKKLVQSFNASGFFEGVMSQLKWAVNFVRPLFEQIIGGFKMIWNSMSQAFKSIGQFFEPIKQLFNWLRPVLSGIIDAVFKFANFVIKAFTTIVDVAHTIYVALDKLGIIWIIGKAFEAVWWVMKKIGDGLMWIYEHTLKPIFDAIGWAYDKIKDLLGIKKEVEIAVTGLPDENKSPLDELGSIGAGPGGADTLGSKIENKADKVSGQKSVNITVNIQKMIGIDKFVSSDGKKGAEEAGENVFKLLLGAVNQFSASTDI